MIIIFQSEKQKHLFFFISLALLFTLILCNFNLHNIIINNLIIILLIPAVSFGASKITKENGEDFSWNGIWFSGVKILEHGWSVEMKIP